MYGDIQFGIVIPTYYRKDGETIEKEISGTFKREI